MNKDKKAILVVSFGTSYNDTREKTIGAIEKRIAEKYPSYDIRRAFTSKIIIKLLKDRDGVFVDDVTEALEKLFRQGYEYVVIQPTHVMNGFEYDELMADARRFEGRFRKMTFGKPLLTSSRDYEEAVLSIVSETSDIDKDTAAVFMGHGTEHYADSAYAALDYRFKALGYDNYFVGISPTFENPPMNRTSILSFERIVTCSTILLINVSSNSVNSTILMSIAFRISSSCF